MTKASFVKHSEPMLKSVSFEVAYKLRTMFEKLYDDLVEGKCDEALKDIGKFDTEANVYLPWIYGDEDGINGESPEDPLTVYVSLPFYEAEEDERPRWSFSLKQLADDFIEGREHGRGGHLDDDDKIRAKRIAAELRALAETFEQAAARE